VRVRELAEYLAGFSRTLGVVGLPAVIGGLMLSAGGTATALPGRPAGYTGPVRPQHQPTSPRRSFATTSFRRFPAHACVKPAADANLGIFRPPPRRQIAMVRGGGGRPASEAVDGLAGGRVCPFFANSATFVQAASEGLNKNGEVQSRRVLVPGGRALQRPDLPANQRGEAAAAKIARSLVNGHSPPRPVQADHGDLADDARRATPWIDYDRARCP
jgi:hypothetical protein